MRLVEISKGNSQFALVAYLAQNAATIFARLVQEQHLRGMTFDAFAQRAAYYLGELNALHPFREGNGRTQRAFLSQLAHAAGYLLHWERITADQMIDASVLSLVHGDNSGFADILHTSMVLILP